jgi:hypothetical protein
MALWITLCLKPLGRPRHVALARRAGYRSVDLVNHERERAQWRIRPLRQRALAWAMAAAGIYLAAEGTDRVVSML